MDGPWPELKAKKMKKQNDQDLSELPTGIHSGISTGGTGHFLESKHSHRTCQNSFDVFLIGYQWFA